MFQVIMAKVARKVDLFQQVKVVWLDHQIVSTLDEYFEVDRSDDVRVNKYFAIWMKVKDVFNSSFCLPTEVTY